MRSEWKNPLNLNIGSSHERPRRLRQSEAVRQLVMEDTLGKHNLIAPIFVSEQGTSPYPIPSLPGVSRVPLQDLPAHVARLQSLGLCAVMIFPVVDPSRKSLDGAEAWNPDGLAQRASRIIKQIAPGMCLFADVALDPYTTHGHDGILGNSPDWLLNDETVEALCKQSLSLAEAGVDFVSPSDMMDGRIGAIRNWLDRHGWDRTGILAYSAKFASALYGPFREAVASGPRGLNKRTYQLSTPNIRQALREVALDLAEGADMVMVKPGTFYLDVVARVREMSHVPVVTYHVSGEYAMLKAAVQNNWIDEKAAVLECLLSMRRAGSDLIVTYYAEWAAENLF